MPIRTNRGRAAVYRKLWGWPVRSPRHLMVTLFGLTVLAILVGFAVPQAANPLSRGGSGRPALTISNGVVVTTSPGGGTRLTTRPSTSPVPRVTAPTPTLAPPAPEALAVAEAWARAWVNHPDGITGEQWAAQLAPLTTEELLPQLRTIDPANIPSTAVTGKAEPVASSARAVEVRITTDGAQLRLTVIATSAGWRVSAYNRVD
jgi:hypothetical protein